MLWYVADVFKAIDTSHDGELQLEELEVRSSKTEAENSCRVRGDQGSLFVFA